MDDDAIRWGRRPGQGWVPVTPGAHVRADLTDDLVSTLQAWQLVLPFWSSFTGLTAALVRGWWVPPLPDGLPLFVASGRADRISRRGLAVCRHDVLPAWQLEKGVRLTSPAETLLSCARDLGLLDVVVLGEAALHAGDLTRADLITVARQRRRGAPLLRRAIRLMDGRAESIFEVVLRILYVVCAIPVVPQFVVRDEHGGVVARADLRIIGTNRLSEYDGGTHLLRHQQRRDLRRVGLINDAGFERRGYTQEDVLVGAVAVLRDADRALGRPHDPARIQVWHRLVSESLFSAAGRQRLMRRLGIDPENAE